MVILGICQVSVFASLRIDIYVQLTGLICLLYVAAGFILKISIKFTFVIFNSVALILSVIGAVTLFVLKIQKWHNEIREHQLPLQYASG